MHEDIIHAVLDFTDPTNGNIIKYNFKSIHYLLKEDNILLCATVHGRADYFKVSDMGYCWYEKTVMLGCTVHVNN